MQNIIIKNISIDEIKPRMVVAKDIFSSAGELILPKNSVISLKHINKLKLLKVKQLSVFEKIEEATFIYESDNDIFLHIKEQYVKNYNTLSKVFNDIVNGSILRNDIIFESIENFIKEIGNYHYLFKFLFHLHIKYDYIVSHCINVAILSNVLAKWLQFDHEKIKEITLSGFLHDIGKIYIEKELINKPAPLTEDEFDSIKRHTTHSIKILEKYNLSPSILRGIQMHHERIDGSGYPKGIAGDRIHEYAKIIAITDIYDAMTSDRSYRNVMNPFEVIELFENMAYTKLASQYSVVFLNKIASNYIGSKVILSNNEEGEIILINPSIPSKPMIKTCKTVVDLSKTTSLKIKQLI